MFQSYFQARVKLNRIWVAPSCGAIGLPILLYLSVVALRDAQRNRTVFELNQARTNARDLSLSNESKKGCIVTLEDFFSYTLKDKFYVDQAVIVGPYPTRGFFKKLQDLSKNDLSGANFTKLTILADDGWAQSQLDDIEEMYEVQPGKRTKLEVLRVSAPHQSGLVHAKIYLFHLKNNAGTYSKRVLLIGSANASSQGWGMHAETFVCIDIADIKDVDERKAVVGYFDNLVGHVDVEYVDFYLQRNSWIRLPSIKASIHINKASSFDNWLRRGRLCHKYQVDQTFGRLTLHLMLPLPKSLLESSINRYFGAVQDSQGFSRNYVEMDGDDADSEFEQNRNPWRKKYFVETYYGYWTSGECFDEMMSEFVSSRATERKQILETIMNADGQAHAKWLNEYTSALENVASTILEQGKIDKNISLEKFLRVENGEVALQYYRLAAEKKLQYDQRRARDRGFADRFISGYTFPTVPQVGDCFEAFALDFCQTLITKLQARKRSNLLAMAVREAIGDSEIHSLLYCVDESEEDTAPIRLLEYLRNNWSEIGSAISIFY